MDDKTTAAVKILCQRIAAQHEEASTMDARVEVQEILAKQKQQKVYVLMDKRGRIVDWALLRKNCEGLRKFPEERVAMATITWEVRDER